MLSGTGFEIEVGLFAQLGVVLGLTAAGLFGASTPAAKWIVGSLDPQLAAGLFYLGSGVGLGILAALRWLITRVVSSEGWPKRDEWRWFLSALVSGGIVGPVFLMYGLRLTTGASASLFLNLEGVFTSLVAWFVFRENFDRRIFVGMLLILAGGFALSWQPGITWGDVAGPLLIACACASWAIDNNLTRKVSASDPVMLAMTKGLVAGSVNVVIALTIGASWPLDSRVVPMALGIGFAGYGLSLVCFILALRHLGTARTGAYFSTAPFWGTFIALGSGQEPLTSRLMVSAALMACGVYLHLTERHVHEHDHGVIEHSHRHAHDDHHLHEHEHPMGERAGIPHTHHHRHEPIRHAHEHYPDVHHQHH